MPVSFESGKDFTRSFVANIKHERMLDIGAGCGTYAKIFPESKWTAVEIWEPYVEEFGLKNLYQNIIIGDARNVDYSSIGHFDVAIAGDVLEHMTSQEAKDLLNKLRDIADFVIVSIPLGHHPQGEVNGNIYESHIEDWTDKKVKDVLGYPTHSHIEGVIGVYIYKKNENLLNKKLKICVYAISKNEAQFVKRFAESAREADLIMVADTGSTDNTIEECKKNGVTVHEICITPWRFDHARNAAIALIPRDIDICISLDLDEVMEPGWREEIERVWTPETTRLSYLFDWGAGIKFRYEKIHARHGYFWHHPCHEYPVFDKRIKEVYAHTDKLLVSHHPDPTKSRGQYMDLLQLSVDEDPNCPRNAFYYARELSFHKRWQEAIDACKKYLALPGATWLNERCYAMRVMAECYMELGDAVESECWLQRAAAEAPNTREPWCQLALLYYRQGRWVECFGASMRALSIKDKAFVYTADPAVWGHWAHDLASISAWHMGLKDIALEQAKLAVIATPDDQRLVNNLKFMEDNLKLESKKIPNIIHFMWFTGPKSRNFTFINYLAVKVAKKVQNPDKIYFYYNEDHPENPHWEAMKQYVEMVKIDPPSEIDGVSLNEWPQYQADVVRLQKLHEHGGIYLDTDSFMLKPLTDLMSNSCVLSGYVEGLSDGAKRGENEYISGAVIMAEPKSTFIGLWLSRLAEGLKSGIWAWHCVVLPIEINRERPGLLTLIPAEKFLPFGFENNDILDESKKGDILHIIKDSYTIHMWDTIWNEELKKVDVEYLTNVDNAFTELFKKYG